jgi:hypothetical protein
MDSLLNFLSGVLGVDPATFLLILGVIVSVCNLAGRLIPDDAVGSLGVARKVLKVLGLYLSNRVASGVSVNDTARAVAGATAITSKSPGSPPVTVKLRSPWIVAVLAGIATIFLQGCALSQVQATTAAVCQSVPIAQAALDSATQTNRVAQAQHILDYVNAYCPSVVLALDLSGAIRLGAKVVH